jgi:NADH-quinone oxidoreductase subunit L
MFLALGVGAWSAAMFHFATHACFKSLLFLGAGAVMMSNHHERDMLKLGGLRRQMPVTFWTFLIGAASLAALPLVTGGFYSKDQIIWNCWSAQRGSVWLWAGGLAGAIVTGIYAFRIVFLTFFGEAKSQVTRLPGTVIRIPLIALAFLSIAVGYLQTPKILGGINLFSDFITSALPAVKTIQTSMTLELTLEVAAAAASLFGIYLAYLFFLKRSGHSEAMAEEPGWHAVQRFFFVGWGFDWLYDRVFVRPFMWIAYLNRNDVIDFFFTCIALVTEAFHRVLSLSQTGKARQYAAAITIGAIVTIAIMVLS